MRVGKLVRWEVFDPLIRGAVTRESKGPGGRPHFDPMLMFKVLVLQRLHGLADDATSFQITDRNRFRAFLGLTPGDSVPDGQTISDFRKVPRQRNSREDNALIKEGEVPQSLQDNAKVKSHKDLDARWTKKHNETHYGYKDHVKVDVRDKLILKAFITPASVHDSQALDELIDEGDRVVYADSAYSGAPIERLKLNTAACCAQTTLRDEKRPRTSSDIPNRLIEGTRVTSK